jgi:hypothetical protein
MNSRKNMSHEARLPMHALIGMAEVEASNDGSRDAR